MQGPDEIFLSKSAPAWLKHNKVRFRYIHIGYKFNQRFQIQSEETSPRIELILEECFGVN